MELSGGECSFFILGVETTTDFPSILETERGAYRNIATAVSK